MDDEIKTKLKRYAELKVLEKATAEEMDVLNPEIKEYMLSHDMEKLPSNVGTFSIGKSSRWKYSQAVEDLQEKEKATGVASQVVSTILRFTQPKAE